MSILIPHIVELEALLASRGEKVPTNQLTGLPHHTSPVLKRTHAYSAGSSSTSRSSMGKISPPVPGSNQQPPFLQLRERRMSKVMALCKSLDNLVNGRVQRLLSYIAPDVLVQFREFARLRAASKEVVQHDMRQLAKEAP